MAIPDFLQPKTDLTDEVRQRGLDVGRLIKSSVRGTLAEVSRAGGHPADAVRGAVYGVIHGVSDADLEGRAAVAPSLDVVRESAAELGLSEQKVVK